MRRRRLTGPLTVLAALAMLGALAGCSADQTTGSDAATTARASAGGASRGESDGAAGASASRPTATATAPPPAPTRGTCYLLGFAEAVAPTSDSPGVACAGRHTSQTYLVGRLQTAIDGHLVAVDSTTVQHEVADTCPQRLAGWLGGTAEQLRLSLLRSVWFTPTVAQSDAGASWYRCDVVAAAGDDQLARLTTADLRGALASAQTRDDYAMCATDRPGTPDFRRVLCREPHTWRAVRSVDLSGLAGRSGAFPGLAAVKSGGEQDGDNLCADAARAIAPDALDYQWGYEWPTADQWRTGQTYGRCWAPDPAMSSASGG